MTYVLDTNIILHDPDVIYKLDGLIVVPIFCLEEIDKFKHEFSERGRNARYFARILDDIRKEGSLKEGVKLNSGSFFKVKVLEKDSTKSMDENILRVAQEYNETAPHNRSANQQWVLFLTRDCNLRVRADALGIESQTYEKEDSIKSEDEFYKGIVKFFVHREVLQDFIRQGEVWLEDVEFPPNCGVILTDEENDSHSVLGVYDAEHQKIVSLNFKEEVWGIHPRNKEQLLAFNVLLNPEIKLVTLSGQAGTGKTLLALAAGLKMTLDDNIYRKLCVARPVVPLGKDLGYLPGSIEEKLNPWMQPIFDNFEYIIGQHRTGADQNEWKQLISSNLIQIEPLTYIRGRSLPYNFMIIDESQNLTPHEIKTIITRCGDNTKLVLTGDPNQIDNPYIDSTNNGLSLAIEKFKNEKIAAHVTLTKGERSLLAETAAKLFK